MMSGPESATALPQHLLFGFLLIVAPAWNYADTRRLSALLRMLLILRPPAEHLGQRA